MKKYLLLLSLILLFQIVGQSQTLSLVSNSFDVCGSEIFEFQGKLFFSASTATEGSELWTSDGTTNGTSLFKDINTNGSSGPKSFVLYNGKMFFTAETPNVGRQLWVSDGTPNGTNIVTVLNINCGGAQIDGLIVFNNKLFFYAQDTNGLGGLWKSDGTAAGTILIRNIALSMGSRIIYNGALYFSSLEAPGGMWKTDGSLQGTVPFHSEKPNLLYSFNNMLLFSNNEMYQTNGTTTGTQILKDFNTSGNDQNSLAGIITMGGAAYYTACTSNSALTRQLIRTDGTLAGTQIISNTGSGGPYSQFGLYNNKLHYGFTNGPGNNIQYWTSDGTSTGTQLLSKKCRPVMDFKVYNNKLFFLGTDTNNRVSHYISDGTDSGVVLLDSAKTFADPAWGITTGFGSSSSGYHEYNGSLFFLENATYNTGLWKYNSNAALSLLENKIINTKVKVYPNPTNNELHIRNETKEILDFELYNMTGQRVLTEKINPHNDNVISIDYLPPTIYQYRISNRNIYLKKGKLQISNHSF